MSKRDLTAGWLREHYHYDQETGILYRKKRVTGKILSPMQRAGVKTGLGYRALRIGKHTYSEQEIIYLWMTGKHKVGYLDHIDGVRDNNKWNNLRVTSQKVNNQNLRKAQKNNKLGLLGVSVSNGRNKYVAQITINGRQTYLGLFTNKEDAHQAYLNAKRKHHQGCTI